MDCQLRRRTIRSDIKTQQERCTLQVGVNVTPQVWLKGFEVTTYITKGVPSFLLYSSTGDECNSLSVFN